MVLGSLGPRSFMSRKEEDSHSPRRSMMKSVWLERKTRRAGPMIFSSRRLNSTTRDPAKYVLPSASNGPTFDSFFRCGEIGAGLQMTLSEDHTLNIKGLRMLYSRLNAFKRAVFCFCRSTRTQVPTYMARFKYFTLNLPMSDSEHVS